MKRIFLLSGLIFIFGQIAVAQDFTDAFEYLSFIKERNDMVIKKMWDYTSVSVHSKRDKKIDKQRDELKQTIAKAKIEISQMPPFNGDATLRDSMVANFDFYLKELNGDLVVAEQLQFESQQSYQALLRYMKKQDEIDKQFEEQRARVQDIFDDFAEKNNIHILENETELQKKITQASLVYDYYDKIYVIFFHSYIAEIFLAKAINDDDTVSFQTWSDSLKVAYMLGNEQIKKIPGYGGDYTLKFVCQKALNHFSLVCNSYVPVFDKYYKAVENYNRQKVIIDKIPEASRTQKDIDRYNAAVEAYNKAIEDYNKTVQLFNKSREDNLTQWNNAKNKFFDKYIPK